MEFHEKLQELRKDRGLTQEELGEALCVTRTAVSKWESGRGYPSIDSLKQISEYFNVTIDDLLSGEVLINIAEKENQSNMQRAHDMMLGIVDMLSLMLIILPLYPETLDGHVYAVDLLSYNEIAAWHLPVYWSMFTGLTAAGVLKIVFLKCGMKKCSSAVSYVSIIAGVIVEVFLIMSQETYAAALAFLLLMIKVMLWQRA